MIDTLFRKIKYKKYKLTLLQKGLNTSFRKAMGKSDINRWSNQKNLSQDWDARTKQIAAIIEPGTSVIEFGAGRLLLKKYLPESCSYTPSDLVDRGPGTVVCDLNDSPLPQFQSFDVAVFSGVLEYVHNVPELIRHLSLSVTTICASYAVIDMNKENRRAEGWVNDFSKKEFIALFQQAGFHCEYTEIWQTHVLFIFVQN